MPKSVLQTLVRVRLRVEKCDSYHKRNTLDNIEYGHEAIESICSDERDLRRNLTKLESNLCERGYPISKVRNKIKEADKVSRDDLLNLQSVAKKQKHFTAPFVTIRNPRLPPLSKIIKKHFPI